MPLIININYELPVILNSLLLLAHIRILWAQSVRIQDLHAAAQHIEIFFYLSKSKATKQAIGQRTAGA